MSNPTIALYRAPALRRELGAPTTSNTRKGAAKAQVRKTPDEAARRAELVARARENRNEFFTLEECGIILGFAAGAMGRLNAAGAPQAFRKMNPGMVREWIAENHGLIGKIRSPS